MGQQRRRNSRALPALVAALAIGVVASLGWWLCGAAFVAAPGRHRRSASGEEGHRRGSADAANAEPKAVEAAFAAARAKDSKTRPPLADAATVLLSVAAGVGATAAARQLPREGLMQRRASRVDWAGSDTGWSDIKERSIFDVDWLNVHGVLTASSALLFLFQSARIATHQAPGQVEVWATTAIYLPWIFFCFRDTEKLENHYRVTFYASCGWAFMSLASLHSVIWQKQFPELAFDILVAGNTVFFGSCVYFYGYHWSRMWRHYQQNRFRPLWIPGLLGLMCLHSLTVVDFVKRLDDQGWWKTICTIYPDEWWWVADVRFIELFVTAAALWLIILHVQGVFTGMKNAAIVVICTIFLPLGVMVAESTWLRASAWQHYFMVGPKYW